MGSVSGYIDVERAKRETPFGSTIAHGFLTVALLSRMSAEAAQVKSNAKMRGFAAISFLSA